MGFRVFVSFVKYQSKASIEQKLKETSYYESIDLIADLANFSIADLQLPKKEDMIKLFDQIIDPSDWLKVLVSKFTDKESLLFFILNVKVAVFETFLDKFELYTIKPTSSEIEEVKVITKTYDAKILSSNKNLITVLITPDDKIGPKKEKTATYMQILLNIASGVIEK